MRGIFKVTNLLNVRVMLFMLVVLTLSSCGKVPIGYVGVRTNLYGSGKGSMEKLTTGYYFISPNQSLNLFPTFVTTKVWTSSLTEDSPISEAITFQSKEGVSIVANVGIEFYINPDDAITMLKTYNTGYDDITNKVLYNVVRNALTSCGSIMNAHEIAGEQKREFTANVKKMVVESAREKNIQINDLYIIDKFGVSKDIEDAINAKAIAKQKAEKIENDLRAIYAEARKDSVAAVGKATALRIEAAAEAEANRVIANSLTKELTSYKAMEKWDGELPTVTSGAVPFINIK